MFFLLPLQEAFAITHLPPDAITSKSTTPNPTARIPPSRRPSDTLTPFVPLPNPSLLHPQALPPFQLPFQSQSFLLLLSQISFGTPCSKLTARFLRL